MLAGQLFTGWTNDLHDAELDRRQQRRDKPIASGDISERAVRFAALGALAATLPLSLANGVGAAAVHLVALAAAAAYNFRLKPTPVSVVPYALAFALLPCFVTLGLPDGLSRWPHAWAPAAGALLGAGAHFTQSLPDVEADRAHELKGLPATIGARRSALAAAALMLAATGVISFGPGRPAAIQVVALAVAAILAAGIAATAAARRARTAFRLTLAIAAVAAAGFLASGRSL